ncbi:MAG: Rrf2 family transcriptional regulator [Hydrogenophilales bacterium CG03_land_8_20_14_0_80_62_28]|nr:Rrf2 family transcriptional regulator [Betaproteobacteria bacterium]OIO78650.1 MAG: Rrf2 family transcriptional regulator [Hydrogenophilaceae bacterium CG1_02_62_390]PIV22417.1 MAG: Rrf2 family transcriptional regulator [Hydrogenophilales bacterium CG03_land_8_20_14_0_80_62_28]PIW38105.1 MAG: Rrf2 family transcriptional regulator [Hydrogenophilales bacterium CG15_BIG_FIL_POST_REV_8_21_14_020_62_31]PIW72820.1 MAG: Rrf2 family transcriptional regulator [Hydrogenophilales bacterium CG12_big_fil
MVLSRTSQYAIQALIYIATQAPGVPVLNRDIAERLNVPAAYLAKILQNLCKHGLLDSFRGRLGGFCLREGMHKSTLMQVLLLTEGPDFTQNCILGLKRCSDETACPLHLRWKPVKNKIIAMMNDMTLEDLAKAVLTGKYRLADLPVAAMPAR